MFTIREKQLEVLTTAHARTWYVDHLRRHFSGCSEWETRALEAFVEFGIAQALTYGIRSPKCVCRYLDVMAAHGADFDTSAKCQWWAGAVLRGAPDMNEDRRTRFLTKSALIALRKQE
jgi:hypothetical protein